MPSTVPAGGWWARQTVAWWQLAVADTAKWRSRESNWHSLARPSDTHSSHVRLALARIANWHSLALPTDARRQRPIGTRKHGQVAAGPPPQAPPARPATPVPS